VLALVDFLGDETHFSRMERLTGNRLCVCVFGWVFVEEKRYWWGKRECLYTHGEGVLIGGCFEGFVL
jgi:hypothetical protein